MECVGPVREGSSRGRGARDEGRGTRDEGRGTRDEGRGTRDEGGEAAGKLVAHDAEDYSSRLSALGARLGRSAGAERRAPRAAVTESPEPRAESRRQSVTGVLAAPTRPSPLVPRPSSSIASRSSPYARSRATRSSAARA